MDTQFKPHEKRPSGEEDRNNRESPADKSTAHGCSTAHLADRPVLLPIPVDHAIGFLWFPAASGFAG